MPVASSHPVPATPATRPPSTTVANASAHPPGRSTAAARPTQASATATYATPDPTPRRVNAGPAVPAASAAPTSVSVAVAARSGRWKTGAAGSGVVRDGGRGTAVPPGSTPAPG